MSQQRFAYLIGANGPQHMRLRYAETDAMRLAQVLMGSYCQFTEAKAVIADSRDTGLASLQKIARQCDPSDTLLVHFSGHAIFDRHLYLLCNNTDCENFRVTAIDIRTVKDILSECRSQSKLLILDCCHAKGAYDDALKGEEEIRDIVRKTSQGETLAILSACARKDRTREFSALDGGSGFLSWAVRKACSNDFAEIPFDLDHKALSLSDLDRWIKKTFDYVNRTLNISPSLPIPYLLRDQAVGHEIWLTPQPSSERESFSAKHEKNSKKYLEQVYRSYNSVTLPIGPSEDLSLHAIFQPLALVRDPLAAEDLERKQRRKLLGESNEKDYNEIPQEKRRGENREEGKVAQSIIAEHGEDALSKSPQGRVVILGGPGSGKTTTLKYLVSRRAYEALERAQNPLTTFLPIFLSLADLARSGKTLQSYLIDVVEGMKVDRSYADVLWAAIEQGRAFVALDSLDEVAPSQRSQMVALINSLASDQGNVWLIGSRFTEYKSGHLSSKQFTEWELLSMTSQLRRELAEKLLPDLYRLFQVNANVYPSSSEFVDLLEKHSQAATWGENPLLFSLAAAVYAKTGGLPSSRAILYHDVIEAVLTLKEPDSVKRKHLLRVLTGLSLWLYTEKRGRTFTLHDVFTFLEDIKGLTWTETESIAKKITTSGVLDFVARQTYGFRHQTFQEYLAAAELAHLLTSPDEKRRESALALAWSKRTYSRWTEILCLMVGILVLEHEKDGIRIATFWLQKLAAQNTQQEGDPGNLGLALMLKSMREITSVDEEIWGKAEVRGLEQDMITFWLHDLLETAHSNHETRGKRLRDLASDIVLLHPTTVDWTIEQLLPLLFDKKYEARWTSIETLGLLGDSVPLAPLINVLYTDTWHMKMAALRAMKTLKKYPSLDQCRELFSDDHRQIREALIETLDNARDPLFRSFFVDALSDKEPDVRHAVIKALGNLAADAPVKLLLSVLNDENVSSESRIAAAESLGKLGKDAPIEDLIDALNKGETSQYAAMALGMLGPYAPISSLIEATTASISQIRIGAAKALGNLKNHLAIMPLLKLLKEESIDIRRTAIETIEKIIEPVSTSGFIDLSGYIRWHLRWQRIKNYQVLEGDISLLLDAIVSATKDVDKFVCIAAIRILAMLGDSTSIESLLDALHNDSVDIRRETIRSLGMLEKHVPVEVFVRALEDENWEVREAAIETLGALGQRAPIETLRLIIQENGSINIYTAAMKACGMLGQYAPIDLVIEALDNDDFMVIDEATRALTNIGQWIDAKDLFFALEKNKKPLFIPAIQILGILEDKASLNVLLSLLQVESWDIRKAVINALSHWGKSMPKDILRELFYDVENLCDMMTLADGSTGFYMWAPSVCVSILEALISLEEEVPIDVIAQAAINKSEDVRHTAIRVLDILSKHLSNEVLFETLEDVLEDESFEIHLAAVRILYKRGIKVSLKRLKAEASNKDISALYVLKNLGQHSLVKSVLGGKSFVEWLAADLVEKKEKRNEIFACFEIISVLGKMEDAEAVKPLIEVLEGEGYSVDDCDEAVYALGNLIKFIPINWFIEKLNSADEWMVGRAILILQHWNEACAVPQEIKERIPLEPLIRALYNHEEENVRAATTAVLGMRGERVPVDLLLVALGDISDSVREAAIKALRANYLEVLSSFQAEARAILEQKQSPGNILGAPVQSFIARMIGEMGLASFDHIQKLNDLLFWPHWQVQLNAIESFRKLHRSIPDDAIRQLLYLRQNSQALCVRQAADNALAELLSLETGLEED